MVWQTKRLSQGQSHDKKKTIHKTFPKSDPRNLWTFIQWHWFSCKKIGSVMGSIRGLVKGSVMWSVRTLRTNSLSPRDLIFWTVDLGTEDKTFAFRRPIWFASCMNNPQRETNLSASMILWGGVSHFSLYKLRERGSETHIWAGHRLWQRDKRSQIDEETKVDKMISRVLITALFLSKSTLSKPTTNAHVIKVTQIYHKSTTEPHKSKNNH